MKSQLYTNIVLSLIAVFLLAIFLQNANIIRTPKKDVQIVSIVQPSESQLERAEKDSTADMRWDDLPIDGTVNGDVTVSGDVSIDNTFPIEVKIEP